MNEPLSEPLVTPLQNPDDCPWLMCTVIHPQETYRTYYSARVTERDVIRLLTEALQFKRDEMALNETFHVVISGGSRDNEEFQMRHAAVLDDLAGLKRDAEGLRTFV